MDDFPLYVMRFYGDYPFREVLENGTRIQDSGTLEGRASSSNWACTCVAARDTAGSPLLARNFDWQDHPALLLFTDPSDGYASVSVVDISYLGYGKRDDPRLNPGALFDAPMMPFDGMNEKGLAVGMMAVPAAEPPLGAGRVTISSLHVIRLMLDDATTVDEAITLVGKYSIDWGSGPPLHYIVADVEGNAAVIEFVGGRMQIVRSRRPWLVSTNFVLFGKSRPARLASCWRYAAADKRLAGTAGRINREAALDLLRSVSQSNTIWSVLYDLAGRELHLVMGKKFATPHRFELR